MGQKSIGIGSIGTNWTRYVLTYDSWGELSIEESVDSSLTGFTMICGRNNRPDDLVFCLEPIGNTNDQGNIDPFDRRTN
jgi:hypothetical protein